MNQEWVKILKTDRNITPHHDAKTQLVAAAVDLQRTNQ